ncbi:MAG: DUF3179 domain-containing protein [Candidatus Altiarchaeota archaeon]|nr:DUF3179 domain-containing protein [Candidatus Altiarchaeota archaeon]
MILNNSPLEFRLNDISSNIISGGPPKDGIPPIDSPKYVTISQANFMESDDIVFLIEGDNPKIYPQKILVWHEIVNENFDGVDVSITYCPLTGSAIGYLGDFGTSGKLVNSNLIMYDRQTDSYWPQILGQAINGEKKGDLLTIYPVIWTTWEKAILKYPIADVLSTDTGAIRDYTSDPYGSYQEEGNYYDVGEPFFPTMNKDLRLPPKTVVTGVFVGNKTLAIPKHLLKEQKLVNFEFNNVPLVFFFDAELGALRVYERSSEEKITIGELTSDLKWVPSYDVMWFGWSSFFPETLVYGETN